MQTGRNEGIDVKNNDYGLDGDVKESLFLRRSKWKIIIRIANIIVFFMLSSSYAQVVEGVDYSSRSNVYL